MKLSKYLDLHNYPRAFFRYPILVRLIYYVNFLTILRNWYVKYVLRKIEKQLPKSFCFLDAGCGMGEFAIDIAERNRSAKVVGIDINVNNVRLANFFAQKRKINNVKFVRDSLINLKQKRKYDLILCNSTLQFIKRDMVALRRIISSLKTKGKLLLYVPVTFKRYVLSHRLESKVLSDFFYKYHDDFLMHKYTIREIKNKIKKSGFKIISVRYTYGVWGAISFEMYSLLLVVMKKLPLVVFIPVGIIYMVFLFPVQLILMAIDFLLCRGRKRGNGMLVVAER